MASAVSFAATGAHAGCAFENTVPLKSLTDAMAECGNFEANLDQDFRPKQPEPSPPTRRSTTSAGSPTRRRSRCSGPARSARSPPSPPRMARG
ncbi:MAG: hypothetical protein R3D80_20840 [Paracoccaceae bacterium]